MRDFLVLFSVFVRYKVTVNENISFGDYWSGIRLPGCSRLDVNWKNEMTSRFAEMALLEKFFEFNLCLLSSLVTG